MASLATAPPSPSVVASSHSAEDILNAVKECESFLEVLSTCGGRIKLLKDELATDTCRYHRRYSLRRAIRYGHLETVKVLVEAGVSIYEDFEVEDFIIDKNGFYLGGLIDLANRNSHVQIVEYLQSQGGVLDDGTDCPKCVCLDEHNHPLYHTGADEWECMDCSQFWTKKGDKQYVWVDKSALKQPEIAIHEH